jgi:hypothetical protein
LPPRGTVDPGQGSIELLGVTDVELDDVDTLQSVQPGLQRD